MTGWKQKKRRKMMTYQETLDYMFNSLPMYHRVGQAAYKADITNTEKLMDHLGHPERGFRSLHVAGTNGKGSVSHMLCSVLMQAGYKVGLYTSPHLIDFRERIRINGEMIAREAVVDFVERNKQFMQSLELSFFEMTVGLAFDYFASEKVDVAVVEVGMGGRLDSTNVITPDLSIITNIGFDHTQFLGDTLAKIAGEKAGIIKKGVPVVIGETHAETRPVFEAKAKEMEAPILFADDNYTIVEEKGPAVLDSTELRFKVKSNRVDVATGQRVFVSPLTGSYQLHNIATLFQALELLPSLGYPITMDQVANGIARVVEDTGLHGRWEKMDMHPLTICETAHNGDGVEAMLHKLKGMPYSHLHLVYGCVNDKDFRKILKMMPHERTTYYYSQPSVPRRLPVEQLVEAASGIGMEGNGYAAVGDAIEAARAAADPEKDMVLVTGSIFLVADAYEYYKNKRVGETTN